MKQYVWLLAALAVLCANSASAQRRTTQGFETQCNGGQINADALTGYTNLAANAYAGCGLASVVTGEANGSMRIAGDALLFSVPNVTGRNALVGAVNNFAPSTVSITFAPAVNEIALQVLGISNNGNLRFELYDASNNQLANETAPAATNDRIYWGKNSTTAIARLQISYPQSGGLLSAVTDWFVDELTFNAWVCGDGEVDNTNGGSELCDDGNQAQCDGCSSTCTASVVGCFDGTTCVAPATGSGCSVCDTSKPAGPTGDIPTSPQPMGTVCDDTLKCTASDACDGAGRCVGAARSCDDAVTCTSDTCSEAAAGDGCTHTLGAHDCLIGGISCVAELSANPSNPCELCDPLRAPNAWSPQAGTVRCAAPTCIGAQFTPAALCDGTGVCTMPISSSCGEFACASSTSCTDTCTDDRECGTASHCDKTTMKCVPNQGAGTPCTSSAQCGNGLACADGVCCESACGSRCETCNAPGFAGKCVNITFGDPENECPDGSSCRAGNQCVQDAPPPPVTPPPPMTVDAGVQPPPTVGAVLPIGAACDRNEVCGLGACRDGVCCDSPCDGSCQGCNVLGSTPGQCTAYSLGTDPENECAGVGGVCSGENACTFYETRGNGLCSPLPGQPGNAKYALSLVALALAWAWRRRRAGSQTSGL
ncbi:MAG: dickkopf-related protein [Polyangiales bacterium]